MIVCVCVCVYVQNLIFRFLQSKARVQVWLYEQTDMRIEGRIVVRDTTMYAMKTIARHVYVMLRASSWWDTETHDEMKRDDDGDGGSSPVRAHAVMMMMRRRSTDVHSCLHVFVCMCITFIKGFDEFMNLVLDEAEEVSVKRASRKPLGRLMLKGDAITLIQEVGG